MSHASPRGPKWRSDSAPPQRRARAQHATPEPPPAPAREHEAHDPARITAHQSHIAQHSTATCIQHLAQHHTQSKHSHTHHLPSGGDLRLAGETQNDSNTFVRSHRQSITAHARQQHNKDNTVATMLFQSTQRTTCCCTCSRKTQHGQSESFRSRSVRVVPGSATRGAHERGRSARVSTDHARTTQGLTPSLISLFSEAYYLWNWKKKYEVS